MRHVPNADLLAEFRAATVPREELLALHRELPSLRAGDAVERDFLSRRASSSRRVSASISSLRFLQRRVASL